MTITDEKVTILVDSHFHLHHISELEAVLVHANSQFSNAAAKHDLGDNWYGALVLTDGAKSTNFSHIKYMISTAPKHALKVGCWELGNTDESCSIVAKNTSGQTIFICAGQQIVTRERLELLSILSDTRVADGKTIDDSIKEVRQQGGLPVLPWGVGKWFGRRGSIVSDILKRTNDDTIFVGDNSARPTIWYYVSQFNLARQKNIPILRGTDPLNIKNKKKLGGDFGFYLSGKFDSLKPAKSIQELLMDTEVTLKNFGKLNKLHHFIADQFAIRFSS